MLKINNEQISFIRLSKNIMLLKAFRDKHNNKSNINTPINVCLLLLSLLY